MSKLDMKKYGLVNNFENELLLSDKQKIGRIISRDNENYKLVTELGILTAEISVKFKYDAKTLSDYPVIGDFVIVEIKQKYNSIIHRILKRQNKLVRKGEWDVNYDHIVASNIDIIFINFSLDNDFNIQKLKAYISISTNCNAKQVIILSASNLSNNIDSILNDVRNYAKEIEVIVISNMDSDFKKIRDYFKEGKTVVFIGPEHDKAKLINKVFKDINFDSDLVLVPGGGIIINTPEMRELGIENINITKKFADIL